MDINIRTATVEDAAEILKIYAPYVENTAISFEYDVPSLEEFKGRIENTLEKYPYLVATDEGGAILGYAYCGPFKTRAAYDWAVETTIYLRDDAKGKGVGRALYSRLEDYLSAMNITNLNACIASIEVEDEHLTNASSKFHERMGYALVGEFHKCGYKFNRWYNMVWMEKIIGEHEANQKPIIKFSEL